MIINLKKYFGFTKLGIEVISITILSSNTTYGMLNIEITEGGRRSPWKGHIIGATWDHIIPYADCKSRFIDLCRATTLNDDEKRFLEIFRNALNNSEVCGFNLDYSEVDKTAKNQRDKCTLVRSAIAKQCKNPSKCYGTISLAWGIPEDDICLGLLLYMKGNGAYSSIIANDPGKNPDYRIIKDNKLRKTVYEMFQNFDYANNAESKYGKSSINTSKWCRAYNNLIEMGVVAPTSHIGE